MLDAIEYLMDCCDKGLEANYLDRSERLIDVPALRDLVLQAKGASIRIRGATIIGTLDLRWCGSSSAPLPVLCFNECRFIVDGPEPANTHRPNLDLSDAHIAALSLTGSRLTHLRAVASHVHGPVDLTFLRALDEGEEALCWCKFSRSVVEGDFLGYAVQLCAPLTGYAGAYHKEREYYADRYEWNWAINLAGARVDGSIILRGNPTILGGILLDLARVQGDVRIDGTLTGKINQPSLAMETARVCGGLSLFGGSDSRMTCNGRIWLMLTDIGGSIDITKAELNADESGIALYAVGTTVGGWFTIGLTQSPGSEHDDKFSVDASGRLVIQGTRVGGYLNVIRVKVHGLQSLPAWWRWLECSEPCALQFRGSHVEQSIQLVSNDLNGSIDFSDVQCSSLIDDDRGYGKDQPIHLEGFRYGRVDNTGWENGVIGRIDRWLPGDPEKTSDRARSTYRSQPFVQLAYVLTTHGDEASAWRVLSRKAWCDAKKRWKLEHQSLGSRWLIYPAVCLYGWLFDFGLSPPRALATLFLSITLGAVLFGWMDHRNALVVAQTPVASWVTTKGDSPKFAASFSVAAVSDIACGLTQASPEQPYVVAIGVILGRLLVYGADVFIPLVDMREEAKCDVGAVEMGTPHPQPWEVTLYQIAKALYATLGWVLTTLALLTFSGVMRHRLAQD